MIQIVKAETPRQLKDHILSIMILFNKNNAAFVPSQHTVVISIDDYRKLLSSKDWGLRDDQDELAYNQTCYGVNITPIEESLSNGVNGSPESGDTSTG